MNIGQTIRYYRKRKALSQKELAEGICSQSEISLIEQDKRQPSLALISCISKKLNISIDAFKGLMHNQNYERVINENFTALEFFVTTRDYISMKSILDHSDFQNLCIDPGTIQKFLCFKSIYIAFQEKNPKKSLKVIHRALLETNSLPSNGKITTSIIKKKLFSKIEVLLIASAASCYYLLKKYEEAERLFDIACRGIKQIENQGSTEMLGTIYYNASKNLKALKKYSLAIEIGHEGLNFEKSKISYYRSAELLFEVGDSYYQLYEIHLAEKYFLKAIMLSYATDNIHFYNLLKDELLGRNLLEKLQHKINFLSI